MGYDDRADHAINVITSATATATKQDLEVDNEVQLHAEFDCRNVYFSLACQLETEATSMASSSERGAIVCSMCYEWVYMCTFHHKKKKITARPSFSNVTLTKQFFSVALSYNFECENIFKKNIIRKTLEAVRYLLLVYIGTTKQAGSECLYNYMHAVSVTRSTAYYHPELPKYHSYTQQSILPVAHGSAVELIAGATGAC